MSIKAGFGVNVNASASAQMYVCMNMAKYVYRIWIFPVINGLCVSHLRSSPL